MRHRAYWIGGLLLAFALPALAEVGTKEIKQASRHTQKGESALQRGDVDSARESFSKSLSAVPDFPPAAIGLGHIAMREKEFAQALEHYRSAERGFTQNGRALLKIQSQRYAQARDRIRGMRDRIQVLQSNSSGSPPPQVQHEITKLENAISQTEAVQPPKGEVIAPPAEVDFYIGNALFQLSKVEEAIDAWESCRTKNPDFAMVHKNLALGYWRQDRLDEARASLARAKELGFPVNPQMESDLANAGS